MMQHFGISPSEGIVHPELKYHPFTTVSIDGLVNFCNTYNYDGGAQFPSHELCELSRVDGLFW